MSGVDLHTTNFVACFLDAQDHVTLTFALTAKGLAAFKRRITSAGSDCGGSLAQCDLLLRAGPPSSAGGRGG